MKSAKPLMLAVLAGLPLLALPAMAQSTEHDIEYHHRRDLLGQAGDAFGYPA